MYLQNAANAYRIKKVSIAKIPSILLKEGEELFRIYYFDALPYLPRNATQKNKENRKKKRDYLEAIRYIDRTFVELGKVRGKDTKCPKCDNKFKVPVQKLVDVKMAVRLVALGMVKTVNKIVLVSGDKDMCPAVETVNEAGTGVDVRLSYFDIDDRVKTAKELIKLCSETIQITKDQLLSCKLEEK